MAKRNPQQTIPAALEDLDTAPLIKSEDGDDEGGDDEDDDEEEEEDEDEGFGKSLPDETDLVKAMNDLERDAAIVATGGAGSLRKSELADKLARGEALSKSETAEFRQLLAAEDAPETELRKSHREEMLEDPQLAQGFEISEFLDAQASQLAKSLDEVRDSVDTGNRDVRAMLGKLAKGMHAIGNAQVAIMRRLSKVEGLSKSLHGEVLAQPQAPRGKTRVGQKLGEEPMSKSQTAPAPNGQHPPLTKSMIGDTLDELIKSTQGAGPQGFGIVEGVDLVKETAKFEQVGHVSHAAMRLVVRKRGLDPSALGL